MIANAPPLVFADLPLARRLELAEGRSCSQFAEARAQANPACGAGWISVAGTFVVFDTPDSPITQTFGLGIQQPPTDDDLGCIEDYFTQRGAPTYHEVSPLADPATFPLLSARGFQPFEFTSVMYRSLPQDEPTNEPLNPRLSVRRVGPAEYDLWARTGAAGWSEFPGDPAILRELMTLGAARPGSQAYLVEDQGEAIAAGILIVVDKVGLLAGASTIPSARNRGAQLALLHARLQAARESGCDLAMMGASPGTPSQRNAERHGFRMAYTRIKWRRGGFET